MKPLIPIILISLAMNTQSGVLLNTNISSLNGNVMNVKITNRMLSPQEVKAAYIKETNSVEYLGYMRGELKLKEAAIQAEIATIDGMLAAKKRIADAIWACKTKQDNVGVGLYVPSTNILDILTSECNDTLKIRAIDADQGMQFNKDEGKEAIKGTFTRFLTQEDKDSFKRMYNAAASQMSAIRKEFEKYQLENQ